LSSEQQLVSIKVDKALYNHNITVKRIADVEAARSLLALQKK
jgi:hypothetical protein